MKCCDYGIIIDSISIFVMKILCLNSLLLLSNWQLFAYLTQDMLPAVVTVIFLSKKVVNQTLAA